MNKKLIILVLSLFIITICLSGCEEEQNNGNNSDDLDVNLFGTWKFTYGVIEQTYTFFNWSVLSGLRL